jgi:glutamyl-tRNA synthetase
MPDIRVRFAPSPTGYMHVGNLHTAVFSWLFARHEGGTFVLRIEDTDELRFTEDAVKVIYEGLRWLGLDWDEGPDIGGPYGPYVQSERLPIYREYIDKLLAEGKAYECFCTPEELEERREIQRARGLPPRYDGRCRSLTPQQREAYKAEGRRACIRFVVAETGSTTINDIIQGDVTYENATIADGVIWKTSGYPTYHFACCVDDYLMKITHVTRAVEHLPNTHLHIQIQDALGFPRPQYAHFPLLLGTDKSKLSKRHGAVSVVEYAEQGYLPEAMFNFMALLGWSTGSEEEILPREEIIKRFRLEGCGKSPAVFDLEKAEWVNGEYIQRSDPAWVADRLLPYLVEAGLFEADPTPERKAWLVQVVDLMKDRAKLLTIFTGWARYFFTDDFEYEDRAKEKWLNLPEIPGLLRALADRLETLAEWTSEALETAVRGFAEERGVKAGNVIHPCRAAVSGTTVGPSLFHLLALLKQDDVVARLRKAAGVGEG